MANDADALTAKIKADITAYQAGLRQAAKDAKATGATIEKELGGTMERVQDALGKGARAAGTALLGIGAAAVAAGGAFALAMNKALDFADALVKTSDKTGISIEELQRLRVVAGQVGLSTDELEGALSKFTLGLGKMRAASKDGTIAVGAIKVALNDDSGPRKAEAVFLDVIRALEKMPDANARAAAAQELFGKSGVNVGLLASQTAGSFDKLRQSADDTGQVIGGDLVRAGDSAGDAIQTLKGIIQSGLTKALLESSPEIEKFIKELTANPQALQETIANFVSMAGAIVQVGGAALHAISFVVDFAKELGVLAAQMTHGSDVPYEDKIKAVSEQLQIAKEDLENLEPDHPMFGFVSKQVADLTKQLYELTQAQQAWLNMGTVSTAPTGPAAAPAPPTATDGGTITVTAGRAKAAADEAKARVDADKQQEDAERSLMETFRAREAFEDEAAAADKKRLDDKIAAERAYNEQHAQALADFESNFLTSQQIPMQAEEDGFAARLGMLADFSDAELEALGGYNAVKEDLVRQHEDKMLKLRQDALTSGLDFLGYIKDDETRTLLDSGAKAVQIAGTYSKKAFKVSQDLAIANAVVNTAAGIARAFGELPFYAALAASAVIAANGAAQIMAIKNAKFGGGGAAGSVPGAGNPNNTTQPSGSANGGVAPAGPQISVNIMPGIYTDADMRRLAEQLQQAYKDGAPRP